MRAACRRKTHVATFDPSQQLELTPSENQAHAPLFIPAPGGGVRDHSKI
jgi:hypothetical protein